MRRLIHIFVLGCVLFGSRLSLPQSMLWADFSAFGPGPSIASPAAIQPAAVQPCAQPAELFDVDNYSGPFSSLVGGFSQKLEVKTITPAHSHRHLPPCALSAGEKFHLFVADTFQPINFLGAAWDAALDQQDNDDPSFGQGAAGYGKRYLAELADDIQGDLFNTFLYPTVFHQDPRYYRLGRGPFHQRLFHAMRHVFAAQNDSGHLMFNYSEWLGTASAKAMSNLYHPGNVRGFDAVAQRMGFNIGTDMGFDVLREFWPQLAHKFRLPFRVKS